MASPEPRLTVAVPLFRAASWADVVRANIVRIPADARIVISLQGGEEGVLDRLRIELGDDPRLIYRRERQAASWRQHANALIEVCETPYFAFLPQDDDVASGYYERLVAALDERSSAGLAFGLTRSIGRPRRYLEPMSAAPIPLGEREPWREALELDRAWNLGIPWRGVVRRELLMPIAATPGDRFADQIWVFGIALAAHLVEVPMAVYVKRYHPQNTHGGWTKLTTEERLAAKEAEVRRRIADPALAAQVLRVLREEIGDRANSMTASAKNRPIAR